MRIIFLGTPDFSVATLQELINSHHEVIAVVTQPDKPVGRNGKVVFSPVKQLAMQHNIPVLQYDKIRLQGVEELQNLNIDDIKGIEALMILARLKEKAGE